jgi:hypothetical protein
MALVTCQQHVEYAQFTAGGIESLYFCWRNIYQSQNNTIHRLYLSTGLFKKPDTIFVTDTSIHLMAGVIEFLHPHMISIRHE